MTHTIFAANAAGKQGGRPWAKGESDNPRGKRQGARHRTTLAAEALLDGEAKALTGKAIELALAGETVALRLCLDRILPPRRERPVRFKLPRLQSLVDVATAMAAIAAAVAHVQHMCKVAVQHMCTDAPAPAADDRSGCAVLATTEGGPEG